MSDNRWIPVTERLPNDRERVLVTERIINHVEGYEIDTVTTDEYWYMRGADGEKIATDEIGSGVGVGWGDEVDWEVMSVRVIAWMPLPEPYKESKNEEEE